MEERFSRTKSVFVWTASMAILFGTVWLLAQLLRWLTDYSDTWVDIGAALTDPYHRHIGEGIAVGGILLLGLVAPGWGEQWFARLEHPFARFSIHRGQAILAAAVLPVVVRLALLPAIPIPQPVIPDEFGYLLLADTFASGRITNPTHPMWRHFETLYVFHQPTYTSIYPAAPGLFMAVPMAFGARPWFGVCISVGLMCAALCWMLQAWMPPKWALFGALLVAGRMSIATYWMNSYWGGAIAALGGALLLGALPRLLRRPRVGDACLAGLGVALLSQSRPFEGALLCLPVGAVLVLGLAGKRPRNLRVLATLACAVVLTGAGTLYYNYRVTGSPWLLPYQLHQKIYGIPQNVRGLPAVLTAERITAQKDLSDNFHWQLGLSQAQSTWKGFLAALPRKLSLFWQFYFEPILTLPLLFLPFLLGRVDVRFLLFTAVFVLVSEFVLYWFFFEHYAAPLCGLLLVLIVQGARRMRMVRWRGRCVGASMFRWFVITGTASSALLVLGAALAPDSVADVDTPRGQIEQILEQRGGKHLVLVRYTKVHDYHAPWIYNAADIDRSPIVWAREMSAACNAELLRYYSDRDVWLVNADEEDPHLIAYRKAQVGTSK